MAGLLSMINIAPGRTTAATQRGLSGRTRDHHWRSPISRTDGSRTTAKPRLSDLHGGGYGSGLLAPPPRWNWPSQEQPACFLSPSAPGDSDCFASCSIYWMRGLSTDSSASATASSVEQLPQDLFHQQLSFDAQRRLRLSQPRHSPFAVEPSTVRHRGCREVGAPVHDRWLSPPRRGMPPKRPETPL